MNRQQQDTLQWLCYFTYWLPQLPPPCLGRADRELIFTYRENAHTRHTHTHTAQDAVVRLYHAFQGEGPYPKIPNLCNV